MDLGLPGGAPKAVDCVPIKRQRKGVEVLAGMAAAAGNQHFASRSDQVGDCFQGADAIRAFQG